MAPAAVALWQRPATSAPRMPGMGRRWSMRAMTLLSAGALGVHELRYLAAYGGDAARALDHQGHAYLALATPLVGGLLAVVLARVLVGVAVGRACDGALVRLGRTWAVAAACLVAVYTTQELVEGVLAPGHPAGVGGVFGHGGWLAMPLAVLVGAVVA